MDPLSIAASSIALIGACRKLAAGLKFLRDLSRAPEEILALTDELNDLQNVLTAVSLVTRKRHDDTLGVLLLPLFIKVNGIIHELCELWGACPQRLKEDNEYTEQLKLQLLARFKWTRAKNRVGELRERLKVLRLDFANSLAAISLLDISHITSTLNALSSGLLEKATEETTTLLDIQPHYESTPMQITTQSKPRPVDLEAQGNELSIAEREPTPKVQIFRSHDPKSSPCKRACSCACHSVYRVKTPLVLQGLVGSLLFKTNGLYGMRQACNEYSCRRSSSASIRVSYRFPEWLLNRVVSSLITSNHLSGPQLSLIVPRVVSNTSDIFFHAFAGNIDGIANLFQLGLASPCDVSVKWGYTPLHYAVDKGHMDLCRFLLKAGARPEIPDIEENTVTDLAWNKICSRKVSAQHAVELEDMFKKDEWFEERQFTVLHKIVLDLLPTRRSLDEELSISTSNLDVPDSEGRTPLCWAAELGNSSAVETLLHFGANIASRSITAMTPLHSAAKAPDSACLSILLNNGASAKAKNKWNQSPLNIASYCQNDPSYISPLLDHGAEVNETDCNMSTNLSIAVYMNNVLTARCLITHGADINSQDRLGITVLNDSIENNAHECISLLLENGASLSLADCCGETPLHILARRGDLHSIEIFQAADLEDVDPEARSNEGLTAWDTMRQRVDVTVEVESAFRCLIARLDSERCCMPFFDAVEKLPAVIRKEPEKVEVRVEEIFVE